MQKMLSASQEYQQARLALQDQIAEQNLLNQNLEN